MIRFPISKTTIGVYILHVIIYVHSLLSEDKIRNSNPSDLNFIIERQQRLES